MEDVSGPGLLIPCQMARLQPRSTMLDLRALLPRVSWKEYWTPQTWLGRIAICTKNAESRLA
jgi:hypothetical protein